MGIAKVLRSCLKAKPTSRNATIVLPGGDTRVVKAPCRTAELLVEFPDQLLCDADSLFLNQPLPSLSLDDRLLRGHTYLLLPSDKFPSPILTTATLASLSSSGGERKKTINFARGTPFEYVKGPRGETTVKITKEFLIRVLTGDREGRDAGEEELRLCSTPELRRHYDQLVGSTRVQPWSPGLETITEAKGRSIFSPLFSRNVLGKML